MSVVESEIILTFPDNNFFRFQDCQGYKTIQHNFKEMDVCWYDQANDILYIIELKNWGDGSLNEESDPSVTVDEITEMKRRITTHRVTELVKKSLDSVSMFVAILLNRPHGFNIQSCSPFTISSNTTIKLLSIINWTNIDTNYISSIYSQYKSFFKPYATVFGVKSYVVMTKQQAVTNFPWIS